MAKYLLAFLFSPKGRFSRRSFFISFLVFTVIFSGYLWFVARHLDFPPWAMLVCGGGTLGIFFIGKIKRFHDFNYSGWTSLWILVPPVYLYFLYLLIFRESDADDNEYGPPETFPAPHKKKAKKPPADK